MYKLFTDKAELFECDIKIEGASLSNSTARLVVETNDYSLMFSGKINSSGKHLLGLINDILDLSKVEAGKMSIYLEPIHLRGFMNDVIVTMKPLADKNNNKLVVDMDGLNDDHITTDVTRLKQIILKKIDKLRHINIHIISTYGNTS